MDHTRPGLARVAFRDLLFPVGLSAAYYDSLEVLILCNSSGTKQAPVSSIAQHATEPTALTLGPPLRHVESDVVGVCDCSGAEMFVVQGIECASPKLIYFIQISFNRKEVCEHIIPC